jgi:D-3-phosphoglycerate dehydrogenase
VRGELSNDDVSVLSLAALRGVFSGVVEDQVTFVNATQIAEARGVAVTLTKEAESPNHRSLVTLRGVYPNGDVLTVSGTVSGIAEIEKVVEVHDRPGVMGVVGTLLGKIGINIEAAQISQTSDGEDAVMILRVDRSVDPSVLESIGASVRATIIRTVDFS